MKVQNWGATFVLKHLFIKALHKRFQSAGIKMEYPIRNVYLDGNAGSETIDRNKLS